MNTHLGPPTRDFSGSEFAVVIALAFGLSIVGSLAAALSYAGRPVNFGDDELAAVIAFEVITAPVIWFLLKHRGWKWSDFAIHYSNGSTILGIILGVATLGVWYVFEMFAGTPPNFPTAGLLTVTVLSIVNPLFEEVLVLAYVVQSMRKRFGLTTAFNVSLAIRLVYHLYQGPLAVIPIAFFGLVVTIVYVRMGRLWPCIVAHAFLDFAALSGLA
jgi:CAAX protease family protein